MKRDYPASGVTMITNIPSPYRLPLFSRVAGRLGERFQVVFCARSEPNRQWEQGDLEFRHHFLRENCRPRGETYLHNNPDIIPLLCRERPGTVITSGFNPTMLYAWGYALAAGKRHIPITDGWSRSEEGLGLLHRLARHAVYRTSAAFIGVSEMSLDLYRSYGVAEHDLFQSPYCIDNEKFARHGERTDRPYDIIFSGQIIERKLPDFFVEVAQRIKRARGEVRVLVIGDGKLRERMLAKLGSFGATVDYAGFVSQADLPGYYSLARILLFTTERDAWGVVANEALASGTPVMTSPYAGVADELVVNGRNGYVLDIDPDLWARKAVDILDNDSLWREMHANALRSVAKYSYDRAAEGIIAAVRHASK